MSIGSGVIIADRAKLPGAAVFSCYDRDDLPHDSHGFIGVLRTDWRPSANGADVFFFIGPQFTYFLRSTQPLPTISGKMFSERFLQARPLCTEGPVAALGALLLGLQSWLPHTSKLAGFSVEAGIDEVLALPGFGCLLQGWVLSPAKSIRNVALRIGERILHGRPDSFSFCSRMDLASVFPGATALLDRAGFVVAVVGELASEDLSHPVLKLIFSDGTSVNFEVDPGTLRRIGHAVLPRDVLKLYPALPHEPFFSAFAGALRADMIRRMREVNAVIPAEKAPLCIIAAVPSVLSDARLLAESTSFHLLREPHNASVVLMADWRCDRRQLPMLADTIRARTGRRCGVYLVENVEKPLWALPGVLAACAATRFLFLTVDSYLEDESWDTVLTALGGGEDELLFLPCATRGTPAAFIWSRSAFEAWSVQTEHALGGDHYVALERHGTPLQASGIAATQTSVDLLIEHVDDLFRKNV